MCAGAHNRTEEGIGSSAEVIGGFKLFDVCAKNCIPGPLEDQQAHLITELSCQSLMLF